MKRIKFNISLSSNKPNTQELKYFINDKEVSELEYYDLNHLKDSEIQELQGALKQCRDEEPADFRLFNDWKAKCSIIEELIAKKSGGMFWMDFID